MTGTFIFKNEDYLAYKLYNASKSKRLKLYRVLGWLLFTAFCCIWAFFFYRNNDRVLEYVFIGLAVLIFIFYPMFQRDRYKKRYSRHVEAAEKGPFNETRQIEININQIILSGGGYEAKLNSAEIVEINETGEYCFFKIRSRQSLVIPKALLDQNALHAELSGIASKYNIPYNRELDWRFT